VLRKLEEVKSAQAEQCSMIRTVLQRMYGSSTGGFDFPEQLKLPLETTEDVRQADEILQDQAIADNLVTS
jgi:hypothetical protein